jgi:hypothetical protein
VRGNIPVDSEALLATDFVNLKIKPAQSFRGAHRGRVCVRVFIGVSAHTCMSICVSKKSNTPGTYQATRALFIVEEESIHSSKMIGAIPTTQANGKSRWCWHR